MNILTDEEIIFIENTTASRSYNDHARAIEAAVLNKLAEQSGDAPVATVVISTIGMFAGIKRNLVLHQDAPILFDGDKLYTEAQLLAAQQRTAEACEEVCRLEAWAVDAMDSIRNGDWREYL